MHLAPTRTEASLLIALGLLFALAVFGPALAQPPHAHDFADTRSLWGIPHALDVLSNLPFAIGGWLGLSALRRAPAGSVPAAERRCAQLFFGGLLVTAAGSAWYHWAPDDLGLAVDRIAMGVAFAGLLGLVAATGVSGRAGLGLAGALLLLAPAAVLAWLFTGNVLPWAFVQFGGIALVVLALTLPARGDGLQVRWSLVLLAYAVAKLFEAQDHGIYEASAQLLSGHTLKHVTAAFAAWPVISAVAARVQRQNGPDPVVHAA
ncbi:MAG TPA: hypothetical protein VGD76_07450 [Ramlibacter sp.]